MKRSGTLDADDERLLLKQAKAGDEAAENVLWEAFDSFARRRAKYYAARMHVDPDQAEGQVPEAILRSVARYDLRRRTRFSTHLKYDVLAEVQRLARASAKQRRDEKAKPVASTDDVPRLSKAQQWDWLFGRWLRGEHPTTYHRHIVRAPDAVDRTIGLALWDRTPPLPQAEIARRQKVSRSAVNQRRQSLLKSIVAETGICVSDEELMRWSLNNFDRNCYLETGVFDPDEDDWFY